MTRQGWRLTVNHWQKVEGPLRNDLRYVSSQDQSDLATNGHFSQYRLAPLRQEWIHQPQDRLAIDCARTDWKGVTEREGLHLATEGSAFQRSSCRTTGMHQPSVTSDANDGASGHSMQRDHDVCLFVRMRGLCVRSPWFIASIESFFIRWWAIFGESCEEFFSRGRYAFLPRRCHSETIFKRV